MKKMSEYLKVACDQLDWERKRNKERPPSDERARIDWIIDQIRNEIIRAEIIEETKGHCAKLMQAEARIDEYAKRAVETAVKMVARIA